MIDRAPAFTPLTPAEFDRYSTIMTGMGLEDAELPEVRQHRLVEAASDRFLGWAALHSGIVVPEFQSTQTILSRDGTELSTAIRSSWPLHAPHSKRGLLSRIRGGGHGGSHGHAHGHGAHPTTGAVTPNQIALIPDRDFWLISSHKHGINQYERQSKWLVGAGNPGSRDPLHRGMYDNHSGAIKLTSRQTDPVLNRADVNRQLQRLQLIERNPTGILSDRFTAAHIANKAARIAERHNIDPSTF